jgi:protoporphyrinogen oxidase
MKRIVTLGAGPTGLGAGYRLTERGYGNWDVYEKNSYVGGHAASFRDEKGFTWDIGGHIIFSHYPYYDRIVERLLGNNVLAHERASWVRLMGSFVRYPFQNNFHFLPEEVVLDCIMGLIHARENEVNPKNFEEWIGTMFGEGIAKYFLLPYNKKVWSHPLTMMDYSWIGERVSVVDIRHVMRNIVYRKDDSSWGPNNNFLFPLHGGTGGLFQAFTPVLGERIKLSRTAVRISLRERKVTFENGEETGFDALISTMPVDELVRIIVEAPQAVREVAGNLKKAGGFIVGVGIARPCPSDKNWIYFPEGNCPFYRVTYLSNYSPNMAPGPDYYSLLCETSYSPYRKVAKGSIVEETVEGLVQSGIIQEGEKKDIVSTYLIDSPYLLPVPTLDRDEALVTIHSFLESESIFSRGRFGGWKYEVGNMDHSVMQGVELIDRILDGSPESTYRTGLPARS